MEKLHILKIGGNVIDNPDLLDNFLADFAKIKEKKILVHGGGKLATQLAEKLSIPQTLIDGRRITNKDTLDLAVMVYAGLINKKIVAQLQALDCNAIGFCGADGNLIQSKKRVNSHVDFGHVGDLFTNSVNSELLDKLLSMGICPVFNAITHDGNGSLLNTNADTIASKLAISLANHYEIKLTYCFEKDGVLLNLDDNDSLLLNIQPSDYSKLKSENIIASGMIPKLDNAFEAIEQGVKQVKICHAKQINGIGTLIQKS